MPNNDLPKSPRRLLDEPAWQINVRVVSALFLREMLTRYGRNNIGFLWLFVEPMLFTLAITAFWSATRNIHGSSIPIVEFALTGYSSMLMWRNMPTRCIGARKSNMPLLYHRQVTVFDVYTARILLEFMAASTSLIVLSIAFWTMDWLVAPEDVLKVLGGWLLLGWFGACLGLFMGALSEKNDIVAKLWPPLSYLIFPLSGAAFLVDSLPIAMQRIVLWLPMLNALEFLREGWFGSAMHAHYDISYVIVFNIIFSFLGLNFVRQIGHDMSDV
jgi:ABC-2 type transport system permease protein/capsular polysaccharide transport system permease protein